MNFKKITIIALIISLVTTTALASVIGTELYSLAEIEVCEGTKYIQSEYIGDQSGVGKQSENYYIYTPNENVVPVVVNDTYIHGKTTVSSMAKKLKSQGLYPIMVMNSDFFSFKTGVPMGHQVIDGIVTSKDNSIQDSFGILPSGEGFISSFKINTQITVGENVIDIDCINKFPQPYSIYLLTDRYSTTTKCEDKSYNVVIGSLSDEMKLDSVISGVVEEIIESDGEVNIPEGKIVLTVYQSISAQKMDKMKLLNVGDEITISNKSEGDERFPLCTYIQGSIGGRLIKNGEIMDIDEDAAPRSAVGIKEDGSIIFYTIDGRQTGHSYGLRLKTLAKRLKELGCANAINFDGGGSTAIVGVYPGDTDATLLNKPSGGSERAVATFFALMNKREPSAIPAKLHLKPYGKNYLSGTKERFSVSATDTNDHPVSFSGDVEFSVAGGSYTSGDGTVVLSGNGRVEITAKSGDLVGSTKVSVFSSPDNIVIKNATSKKTIKRIDASGGETIKLSAESFAGSKPLVADKECFSWETEGGIGTITPDGVFSVSDVPSEGSINVSAGNKTVSIPVSVKGDKYAACTKAEFSETGNKIYAELKNLEGIKVEKENISVTLDGKRQEFKYSDNVVEVLKNGEFKNKVVLTVTNSKGYKSVCTHTTEGKSFDAPFNDTENHWGKDVISYIYDKKVVNGVENGDGTVSFLPDKKVSRYEFSVMIANYLKAEKEDYDMLSLPFDDAGNIPAWALTQVKAMYALGLMNGKTMPDGKVMFDGGATLTRAEAVTVLTRIMGETLDTKPLNFSDIKDAPEYSLDGFATMVSMGVVGGYDDGTIKPKREISKAEAVKMIYGIY